MKESRDIMNNIGERIILLRTNKGINQAEMAKSLNISPSVMNRIELGTRAIRDYELIAIANFLKVSSDYILGIDIKDTNINPSSNIFMVNKQEQDLIKKYRKLSNKVKDKIEARIEAEYDIVMENEQESRQKA
jgi:transcriptional regulator with XRE-family HTH domain